MKNALLILLMILLPWQASASTERNFMHVMGEQQSGASFIRHYAEHADLIMHHHDSDDGNDKDGVLHEDDSEKSARHVADVDHGCQLNVLFPAQHVIAALPVIRLAPASKLYSPAQYSSSPPRRPPRALA